MNYNFNFKLYPKNINTNEKIVHAHKYNSLLSLTHPTHINLFDCISNIWFEWSFLYNTFWLHIESFCRNGSNINGYFTWSFLDVFELLSGYKSSYGLFYVDLDDPDRKRYPKLSAKWFSNFLQVKATSLHLDGVMEL